MKNNRSCQVCGSPLESHTEFHRDPLVGAVEIEVERCPSQDDHPDPDPLYDPVGEAV